MSRMLCMANVQAVPINWLWPGRIARGKLTVIAGDPGLGKSTVTTDLTARITRGQSWPDGAANNQRAGRVLLLSAEDDPADTIRPRLDAAGADASHVFVIPGTGSLVDDLPKLDDALRKLGACRMVVIDPISAYLAGLDSHKNTDVRSFLAPLTDVAARHRAAMVCVSHLSKSNGGNAVYRVSGSLAFTAAARSVWLITRDPDAPTERRLFLPAKNNIGPDASGLSFTLQPSTDNPDIALPVWSAEPVDARADDVLQQPTRAQSSAPNPADRWLREQLEDGPLSTPILRACAEDEGFSWRTIERAKTRLAVEAVRIDGHWAWRTQGDTRKPRQSATATPVEARPSNTSSRDASSDQQATIKTILPSPELLDAWPHDAK